MINYLKSISLLIALALLCPLSLEGRVGQSRRHTRKSRAAKSMSLKKNQVTNGIWGGEQMEISVAEDGASLNFACANGLIKEPLVLDSDGRFNVGGTYQTEHFGPVRLGDDDSQAARYIGEIKGQLLTLSIKLNKSGETIGPLNFSFGKRTRIIKCM